jgi:DeoR family transcriptional regulator, fructose operon transcriptional repressor
MFNVRSRSWTAAGLGWTGPVGPREAVEMTPEVRQRAILAKARAEGHVEVATLAEHFAVAAETVRRDLRVLEEHGMLGRTYGGGYPIETAAFESATSHRSRTHVPEKRRIAAEAAGRLGTAETVFVDEGFTPSLIAEELAAAGRPLTVVTASVPAAELLARHDAVTVMLIGGRVRGRTEGVVGPWAVELLARVAVDLAYLGANGVSREHGLTTPDLEVAAVKARAIASSRRRIFVGTHKKFGVSGFHRFAELTDFEVMITDTALGAGEVKRYRAAGAQIVRV